MFILCRHLEALWFANIANSILWWAFVKVGCLHAAADCVLTHQHTVHRVWGCRVSCRKQPGQCAALLGLPRMLILTGLVSAGLVEGTHHAIVLLLLKDGEASERGLSALLALPMLCLSV